MKFFKIILVILNIMLCLWSIQYVISYAEQNHSGSIAFAMIFCAGFFAVNQLASHYWNRRGE